MKSAGVPAISIFKVSICTFVCVCWHIDLESGGMRKH
jgi:hypothetical protein